MSGEVAKLGQKMVTRAVVLIIITLMAQVSAEPGSGGELVAHRARRSYSPLRVVYLISEPFVIPGGDGRVVGYLPDILDRIGHKLNLTFELYPSPDGRYGALNPDGTWTGMIGELVKKEKGDHNGADVALADISVTAIREKVVNFVKPFKNLGLTVLIQKTHVAERDNNKLSPFNILRPLEAGVWVTCSISVLIVGVLLWLSNRFNPYEWGHYNTAEHGRGSEDHADAFSISGAIWFAFTSLQWQGYEKAPRSAASRLVAAVWFMFVTLTLVTYMGSLLNHFIWASTLYGRDFSRPPAQDLAHLVLNGEYDVGTIRGGSTYKWLTQVAREDIYKTLKAKWETPQGQKLLATSHEEILQKVRSGKVAMIVESLFANHAMNQRPCDLTTVGPTFAPRAYGVPVRQNLERGLLDSLHHAILEMSESGEIGALEKRWFVDRGECWNVTRIEKEMARTSKLFLLQPQQVTVYMFWGPLAILLVGVVISMLIGVAEFLFFRYRGQYERENRPADPSLEPTES